MSDEAHGEPPAAKRPGRRAAVATQRKPPPEKSIRAGTIPLPPPIPFFTPALSSRGAIERRRASEIHAYVGPNGSGKSATMVRDTLPSLEAGRPVLSTVKILDWRTGKPHHLYTPFVHWDQLREFSGGDLLLDEVVGIANARASGMPDDIQNILNQLRRRDVLMRWSAPAYQRADVIIRETSRAITLCHGYAPNNKVVRQRGDGANVVRAWAPNRLFTAFTYDAQDMTRFQASSARGERVTVHPKFRELWWGPSSPAFDAYNTMDPVTQVSWLCPVCKGRPVTKQCRGTHSDDEFAAARLEAMVYGAPPELQHEH